MSSTITALTSGGGIALAGDTSGSLQLNTNNGTNAVTIDTSQNVGIGTTSPSYKIDAWTPLTGTTAGSNTVLQLSSNGSGYDSNIRFADNVNASARLGYLSGNMYFYTNGAERMRIDTSGNLLVGTTSGGYKFTLKGASAIAGFEITNTGSIVDFYANTSTYVGAISTNGSSTSYNTTSDYRLKENIAPMTGALETVAQLKPVTYKWKTDGSDGQGFIAHELQEVVPDCVTGEKDAVDTEGNPVYQGIDTSFLVATLTAAIQEQQTIISDLKARIETLESK